MSRQCGPGQHFNNVTRRTAGDAAMKGVEFKSPDVWINLSHLLPSEAGENIPRYIMNDFKSLTTGPDPSAQARRNKLAYAIHKVVRKHIDHASASISKELLHYGQTTDL